MRTMLALALLVAMSAAAESADEARDILDQRKHLEETTRRWEDLSARTASARRSPSWWRLPR